MATYTPLKTGQAATLGTSGDAVKALQTQLNTANAGQVGYTPLKVDGLYGPLTQAASLYKAPLTTTTTTPPATTSTNPVISGTSTAAANTAIGNDITSLKTASADATKLLQDRMDALEARREQEINSIKQSYEQASKQQETRQGQDYAGRSTGLVTSGGGFLGATQSQQGVLQNLKVTFEQEKTALMAKRDAAIQEAQNAYDDKSFAVAQAKIKEAKDLENEIYTRQKDNAEQQLSVAREARAQAEYERGYTDERVKGYSALSEEEFNKIPASKIAEVDKFYFPGYTALARKTAQQAAAGKQIEDDLKFRNDLQTLINKTPAGQRFTIGDKTYVGMKKIGGTGAAKDSISGSLALQLGVPSLAGKKESDIILSLSFSNPPQWYKEFYAASNPEAYASVSKVPGALQADWKNFVAQPDIDAYKNSAVVTKRIEGANNAINITGDDITNALSEIGD